ncbi:hypothetical protein TNIN_9011 [Trichonephila inaurata madagascariensis]|uniref:Uncharacterized protein n=1 Tax=Trichonephila inaurata madagascariensis TaxID=2747483 RepID=A0A8X7CSG7_9ARAC|nr:hypothetical protein TNIN_9011 [Trichonephila inaurata madagascariensis]
MQFVAYACNEIPYLRVEGSGTVHVEITWLRGGGDDRPQALRALLQVPDSREAQSQAPDAARESNSALHPPMAFLLFGTTCPCFSFKQTTRCKNYFQRAKCSNILTCTYTS